MTRETRIDLRRRVEILSELTGIQFELEEWSPGDGWTRYQLMSIIDGRLNRASNSLPLQQMSEYLNGMLAGLRFAKQHAA